MIPPFLLGRLPEPPTSAEVARHIPPVAPVPEGTPRPFWSVMVPAYNCDDYLRRTLASVLEQDPGPDDMQIEVIDDCSTQGNPAAVAREVGRGRVDFHRNPRNLGATDTFNVCLQRSRGRWVHILHGDDAVLPGFYAAYSRLIQGQPSVAMVIGQSIVIDEHDHWTSLIGPDVPADSPVLRDFCCEQAVGHLGQFASWVIRREMLEQVGGFCTLFGHCADFELAFRIGQAGPVGCLPRAYALYRVHSASDTRRLMVSGHNIYERVLVTRLNLSRLPPDACQEKRRVWRRHLANTAHGAAWTLGVGGSTEGRLNQARWAYLLDPRPFRALFLAKSWVKHRLARARR
jgi:GT2 family glycosyltransferase